MGIKNVSLTGSFGRLNDILDVKSFVNHNIMIKCYSSTQHQLNFYFVPGNWVSSKGLFDMFPFPGGTHVLSEGMEM